MTLYYAFVHEVNEARGHTRIRGYVYIALGPDLAARSLRRDLDITDDKAVVVVPYDNVLIDDHGKIITPDELRETA